MSHKDFTQLDLRPLINMTGSTDSKESEVHHSLLLSHTTMFTLLLAFPFELIEYDIIALKYLIAYYNYEFDIF